jgi:hypothetical protein
MAEHVVQRIGVTARHRGKLVDVGGARGDVLADAQRGHDVNAPRSLQIAQRVKVHGEGCPQPDSNRRSQP